MVRKQSFSEAAPGADEEAPSCQICNSSGPFGRAYRCTFKIESQRHDYFLCKSQICEKKFEKGCLAVAEQQNTSSGWQAKIKQMAKQGYLHCPSCFFRLVDAPVPEVPEEEAEAPPPPPLDELAEEATSLDDKAPTQAEPSELPDFDPDNFEILPARSKDSLDATPTNAGKKSSKKNKQSQKMQKQMVQSLFFADTRQCATDEGELLPPDELDAVLRAASADSTPVSQRSTPIGAPSAWPGIAKVAAKAVPVGQSPTGARPAGQPAAAWPSMAKVAEKPVTSAKPKPASRPNTSVPETTKAGPGAAESQTATSQSLAEQEFLRRLQKDSTASVPASKTNVVAETDADNNETPLPPGWKAQWNATNQMHYYWNTQTREVTWTRPKADATDDGSLKSGKPLQSSQSSSSTTCSQASTATSSTVSSATSTPSSTITSSTDDSLRYVCIRTWVPRDDHGSNCIRVTHGERIILESETLSGWGSGTVVVEPGEAPRFGYFPRWAISDNPALEPKIFTIGSKCQVSEDFESPADGYLSVQKGQTLTVRHQAAPYNWVWAEDPQDPSRSGWAPEAVMHHV